MNNIYTIPIKEIFESKCNCPICELKSNIETRSIEYIMGAAMMEPSVRIETNKLGFCNSHLKLMLNQPNKLSLALLLQTRLDVAVKEYGDIKQFLKPQKVRHFSTDTCFVCNQIQNSILQLCDNTVHMYVKDEDFRALYNLQKYLCLPHFELLCDVASKNMPKKMLPVFLNDSSILLQKAAVSLKNDIAAFTKMFDYRSNASNTEVEKAKQSINGTINFLT